MYIFMVIMLGMALIPAFIYKYAETNVTMEGQRFPLDILKSNLEMLLPIFLSILIADLITDEYKDGTLKLPLIHPISRTSLLNSKIASLAIALLVLIFFSLISSYIIGFIFFGAGEGLNIYGETYSTGYGFLVTMFSHLIAIIPLLAFGMVIVLLSLNMSSSGGVVGASIGIIFGLNILGQLSKTIRPYLINTYFSLHGIILNSSSQISLSKSIIVIFSYGVISYLISLKIFNKKDIIY